MRRQNRTLTKKELECAVKVHVSHFDASLLTREKEEEAIDVLADAFKDNPKFAWVEGLEVNDPDKDQKKYNFSRCLQAYANHRVLNGKRGVAVGARDEHGELIGCMTLVPSSCSRERRIDNIAANARLGTTPMEKTEEYCPDSRQRLEAMGELPKLRDQHMANARRWLCLQSIGIRPEARGKGHARELLRLLTKTADSLLVPVYVEADSKNDESMYKKFGFRTVETVHAHVAGDKSSTGDLTLYLMRRNPRYAHRRVSCAQMAGAEIKFEKARISRRIRFETVPAS
ncbi:hypothetical protein ACHAWF_008903 [Thalassiosira exigua]